MEYTIRLANRPEDYPAIAAVLEAENPGWGESAEELAYTPTLRPLSDRPRLYRDLATSGWDFVKQMQTTVA